MQMARWRGVCNTSAFEVQPLIAADLAGPECKLSYHFSIYHFSIILHLGASVCVREGQDTG